LELLDIAVKAYKSGDLERLNAIFILVSSNNTQEISTDNWSLDNEMDKLKLIIENLTNEIKALKSSFPFSQEDLLKNEKQKSLKIESLKAAIEIRKKDVEIYWQKWRSLIGENHDGKFSQYN
jgi:predicted RNase H-like nuclease (RuvC/YqgF family)